MAREATITQEQVSAAAAAIQASGSKPTARAIRAQLGSGSMATILKYLQTWQAAQANPPAQETGLPAQLQRYLVDFVGQEVAAARASLEADLAEAQKVQADLIAESERLAGTLEGQAASLEAAAVARAELEGRLVQVAADLDASRQEVAKERETAEAVRVELAKAQLRLEAVPRLENDLRACQAALETERKARTDAERLAAVAEAKAEGLADRLEDAQARISSRTA